MNIRGQFFESMQRMTKITIPACTVNGRIIPSFNDDVISIDEDKITCKDRVIEYHLIDAKTDLTEILESASERSMTTLLVHCQFLNKTFTQEMIDSIVVKGAYTIEVEQWHGAMERKLIEVYSLAQAGKWAQFEGYRYGMVD